MPHSAVMPILPYMERRTRNRTNSPGFMSSRPASRHTSKNSRSVRFTGTRSVCLLSSGMVRIGSVEEKPADHTRTLFGRETPHVGLVSTERRASLAGETGGPHGSGGLLGVIDCVEFWPDCLPVVGAKLLTEHTLGSDALDFRAMLNGNAARLPVTNGSGRHIQVAGQFGTPTNQQCGMVQRMR